ncbi:hypothetical protein ACOMHN_016209 [Nucella lapillus]
MVADSELDAQLKDDTELGRLAISVEDGKREDGLMVCIHNANSFNTPTAIVDSIEQVTKQYYASVFNTAYQSASSTPQSDREVTSPFLQPYFHSIHRRGSTFSSWGQAYQQGNIGDIGINDIKYVQNTNLVPTLIVASSTSNSISFYSVTEAPFGTVTK